MNKDMKKHESLEAVTHTYGHLKKYYQKVESIFQNRKKEIVTYSIILIICIMVCAPLLQMHISSDTYNFMDLGYFTYPIEYFMKDARLISTFVTYLAGILKLPYNVFIIIMQILAIIISAFSIYCVYNAVSKKAKIQGNLPKVLIIMASFILIFNCMSLEYLLYAECSIMCLSLLLSILAAKVFTDEKTNKRSIKAMLIMILASFCYQGAINIFLPLVMLFLFIDANRKPAKELIKKILLAFGILASVYLINIAAIYAINLALGASQQRISRGILDNLRYFKYIMIDIVMNTLVHNYNLWPMGVTIISVVSILIILLFQKKKIRNIVQYLILVIVSFGICVVSVLFMESPSLEPRMAMAIGGIVGMSLIYAISINQNKIAKKIITLITILFFVYNLVNTIQIYTAHIATNKIDANMGIAIKYKIEEYEKETGNKVTKVGYKRDTNHRDYHYGWDKKYSSFGQRAFDNYYCIIEALNYYCDRKFEAVRMDEEVYEKYFAGKDWQAYSDEQIVFVEDTMYICTY